MPIGLGFSPIYDSSGEIAGYGGGTSLWSGLGDLLGSGLRSYFNPGAPSTMGNIFANPLFQPSQQNVGLINVTGSSQPGGVSCGSGTCGAPFAVGSNRVRAQDFWMTGPDGKMRLFGPLGSVLLTSRDMRASKKVKRLASRARRAVR